MAGGTPIYVEGPDGLPARVVGPWVERKAYYVDRYAHMVAVGMKNKWERRTYIELFAGPGLSWDKGHRQFIEGSALKAMGRPFTDYLFVDIDPVATGALSARAEAVRGDRHLWMATDDCNQRVGEIVGRIPDGSVNLAFIDPTAAQVRFATVERLAALRTDLLLTFHVGAMRRAAKTRAAQIDAFFPPGADWRSAVGLPRDQSIPALVRLYRGGLAPYGYKQEGSKYVSIREPRRNVLIYVLVLFTKHARGLDFWEKALAGEHSGQLQAFPEL